MNSEILVLLQLQYDNAKTEEERLDILTEQILEIRTDDVDLAFKMAQDQLMRSEKINFQRGIGNGKNHLGACYWIMGEYEDGLAILKEAYTLSKNINDEILEAKVLNNFGRIYRNLGDLANSLRNFEAALEINEKNGNEYLQTINLTNISNLYYDLGDYDTALEYALKCLPIFEKYNNVSRLIDIYNTLGDIYFKKENFEDALIYFRKNQRLSEPESASRSLADSGIGKVLFKLNKIDEAKTYLLNALDEAKESENIEAEIAASYYFGKLQISQTNYRSALKHLETAHELANSVSRKHDMMNIHETLSELFDIMGDIPKAFHHLKLFESLKEEIFQQKTLNKLRNLQIKNQIEVAKKEKEVAERTAHLKQQFMANMSHEIRTPMNAIVGITRLLIEKDPRPDQIKYLNAIKQSADNLLIIINDILDFSKIEAGKIVIESYNFSLKEIIFSLKEMFYIKAEEKNIALSFELDPLLPEYLVSDSARITQILVNLIGNALKFTEKGGVTIAIKPTSIGNQYAVQFDVIDTGIGISEEYVSKIFESFTQAGTDTARKFGGTGLGLTISNQLVDLMNGKITVSSKPNVGTTFSVVIPMEITKDMVQKNHKEVDIKEKYERLNNCKILLVEDNEFNQLVAVDTLKSILPNIEIQTAINGREAVDAVAKHDFDVILMDIQMPVMNGIEATQEIRNTLSAPKKDISIIAMTANVLQDDVKMYFNNGMNAFISKPFNTEELLTKINDLLPQDLSRYNEPSYQPIEEYTVKNNHQEVDKLVNTPKIVLPEQVTDLTFMNQFTNNDHNKRDKYIKMFLQNAPLMLDKTDIAWSNKDRQALKVAAHSLKPQLSYMGVKEDISHVLQLEQSALNELVGFDQLENLVVNLRKVTEQSFKELKEIVND